ncbi:MAG TPA: carboxypeptidase regulatory-like domain-containing protein [Thermoanaerobaculia bacterium]|jgi:hypothetical protein|nr:carboxypeptidase regulatory-like domain-containing protein [Thermoanaerobaculia bacterium]
MPGVKTRPQTALLALLVVIAGSSVAHAQQLDETCTVAVLNRVAAVDSNGFWQLANVPSARGRVRARATCTAGGVTRIGVSEWFDVPTNGVVLANDIQFINPVPVPASLSLTAPQLVLAAIGDTVQLSAIATHPDGATRSVASGSDGTAYTTSNPEVLTVSPDGLVTAIGTGPVIISASNDGALGLLRLLVGGSVDSDNDGMPDDFETANGLDPNDPADAAGDPDGDGLTNVAEFGLGTDIRAADTDGDGIRDGLEVQTGSDPLNPQSFDLPRALRRVDVTPTSVSMRANVIFGEIFQQLTVTGVLLDGQLFDLTSTTFATTYQTDDPGICNFGEIDGRLFPGNTGTTTVTVSSNGYVATIPVRVEAFTAQPLASIAIPGYANNVKVNGGYAFVAAGSGGLRVVDVRTPASPSLVAGLPLPGEAIDLRIRDGHVFLAAGTAGMHIIDVHVPNAPVLVATVAIPGVAQDIWLEDSFAYVAAGQEGLQIVDISTLSAPVVVGGITTDGHARGVAVFRNHAVVAADYSLEVIDVSTPSAPQLAGRVQRSGSKDLVVRGPFAYIAGFSNGLDILDFAVPTQPRLRGSVPQFVPRDVALNGQFAMFAEQLFLNAVPFVDVGNPNAPLFQSAFDLSSLGDYAGTGIDVDDRYVFVTGESFFVGSDFGTTGDTRLMIGQYAEGADTAGIAPTVRITSPAAGTLVTAGSLVPVEVEAADDLAVAEVSLLADGAEVAASFPPFTLMISVPDNQTTMTLGAIATDWGGNATQAANVTLTVRPDPLTTLRGRILDPASLPFENVTVTLGQLTMTTDAAGQYSFSGLSTIGGGYTISAAATRDTLEYEGMIGPIAPVEGTTLVDDLTMTLINPTVRIVSPADGAQFVFNEVMYVNVEAIAPHGVYFLTLFVNDEEVEASYYSNSATFSLPLPGEPGPPIRIFATVNDYGGRSSTSPTVTITVIEDPLTMVRGIVTDLEGNVVPGAQVFVDGQEQFTATTDIAGAYVIPGVPTTTQISVSASAELDDERQTGQSSGHEPVRGGITVISDLALLPAPPGPISVIEVPGQGYGVAANGRFAAVAAGTGGLHTVDLTDETNPVLAGQVSMNSAVDVVWQGTTAFVAALEEGVHVVDMTNPALPQLLATIDSGRAKKLALDGTRLYVVGSAEGMHVYDVSNPAAAIHLGTSIVEELPLNAVTAQGNLLVVAEEPIDDAPGYDAYRTMIRILDATNPAAMSVVSFLEIGGRVFNLTLRDGVLYLSGNRLQIVNLSVPAQPQWVTSTQSELSVSDVAVVDDYAVCATSSSFYGGSPGSVLVVGIADPLQLQENTYNFSSLGYAGTAAVAVTGKLMLFVGGTGSDLNPNDSTYTPWSTMLFVGKFRGPAGPPSPPND